MQPADTPKPSWQLPPLNLTPLFRDPDHDAQAGALATLQEGGTLQSQQLREHD